MSIRFLNEFCANMRRTAEAAKNGDIVLAMASIFNWFAIAKILVRKALKIIDNFILTDY